MSETTTDTLAEIEAQAEPQPVQVREGRWRTRGGEIRHVTPTPDDHDLCDRFPWWDEKLRNAWRDDGRYTHERQSVFDLVQYLGPIKSEPGQTITPDDVAAEAINEWPSVKILRQELEATELALLEQQQWNEQLVTQGSQQYTRIQELRSEVSYVQGLLGDESRRIVELETLVTDLRAVNAAQEKAVNSAARDKADLQHRLDTVAAEWALQAGQISGLQQQLEAVKAELVQVSKDRYTLQIELDAREQVPQATSDRFEEGWDAGTAQAVETIAEWLEPIRTLIDAADNVEQTERASNLAADVMQNLPHIMRSLTGLADED